MDAANTELTTVESDQLDFLKRVLEMETEETSDGDNAVSPAAFDQDSWKRLVTMHLDLTILETFMWNHLEKFFIEDITKVMQGLIARLDQLDKIIPYLDVYVKHYIKRFLEFIAKFTRSPSKLLESWNKRIDKYKTCIYLKEIGNGIFEFIKLIDDEELGTNVDTMLKEIKQVASGNPGDTEEICHKLKEKVVERLLSEDLITEAILSYYFNIVKLLNIIDREMIYYAEIITPVRQYLVKRPDVLKAIIAFWKESLVDGKASTETYRVLDAANYNYHGLESDDDEAEADKWDVQNIGSKDSSKTTLKYKEIDKLSLLFELFGSDSDFIEEYENILAEKLLLSRVLDINEEIKNIELLKLRFGESKLLRSTVILRDVDDSQRFNTNYKTDLQRSKRYSTYAGLSPLSSNLLFVSSGYWPINSGVTFFEYPEPFKKIFDEIHEQFKRQKQIMLLEHHNNLGTVELELKFKNGEKHGFTCEPIQAIIITQFDKNNNPSGGGITLEELAEKLQAHQNYIRSKIFYWIKKGVIEEQKRNTNVSSSLQQSKSLNFGPKGFGRLDTIQDDSVVYELVEEYTPNDNVDENALIEEIDHEQIGRDKISSRDVLANLKKFEPKIISILSLNGPKTINKLKCLLDTVYRPDDNSQILMNDLTEILNALVKRRKITVQNEIYSLCSHV